MFQRILALFDGKEPITKLPPKEAKYALGALMVRTAKVDHAYLFQEVEQIDKILARRNGLNVVEAAKMRAQCELLEEELPDTADLAETLQGAISLEEREAMVAALWSVVFADGVEHEEEDALVAEIEALLGIDENTGQQIHDREMAKLPPNRDD
ncbi:TerB family tellurite resistance protein [Flavimaricola marinus]|uniref:Tellurite resistance protein TerB n=1 Tax=Flavimaricola marinus TaxID=1819565 RepID=A0A238LC93_9RHOB|nr:TerB family tellurite resistance protein [Flavimaricola marinus]SMY07035.1 Tellurite resistance protein TerB [Flavimaricola marinus]